MDLLGFIFLLTLILAVLITNIWFFKKINKTNNRHLKYKILFFLISISSSGLILLIAALFQSLILIDTIDLKVDYEGYPYRIILIATILLFNIIANFILVRYYTRRIERKSKNKTKEIELIGIE